MPTNENLDTEDLQLNGTHRVILDKVDDSGDQQVVNYRGLAGEAHTEVLRIQYHGLSSHPPKDAEGVVVGLGTRDMPVVVGAESPKHRPKGLPEGGTMLYDTADTKVLLDADGGLHISSSKAVTIKTAKLTIEADIEIKGNIAQEGGITSSGAHVASAHV